MRVVPYTFVHQPTWDAVGPETRFEAITDPDGYRLLLDEMWTQGDTFVLVEHDVVPTPGQLSEIEACAEPWCLYGYAPGFWQPVFGCVKFGPGLIAATPGIWENDWPWNLLDQMFAPYAVQHGIRPHWHYPHVQHAATRGRRAASLKEKLLAAQAELALLREEVTGDPELRDEYETVMIELVEAATT